MVGHKTRKIRQLTWLMNSQMARGFIFHGYFLNHADQNYKSATAHGYISRNVGTSRSESFVVTNHATPPAFQFYQRG
jgi:hypothetical protein